MFKKPPASLAEQEWQQPSSLKLDETKSTPPAGFLRTPTSCGKWVPYDTCPFSNWCMEMGARASWIPTPRNWCCKERKEEEKLLIQIWDRQIRLTDKARVMCLKQQREADKENSWHFPPLEWEADSWAGNSLNKEGETVQSWVTKQRCTVFFRL